MLTVTYESGGASAGGNSGESSIGDGGHAYYAGAGLKLDNWTFSADVTRQDIGALNTALAGKQPKGDYIPGRRIGSVDTLAPGAQASASLTGAGSDKTLNLGLPTGGQGAQGPKGEKGDQGPQGEKGEKGDTGSRGATGAAGERGPQGLAGPEGPQGPQGERGEKGDSGISAPSNGFFTLSMEGDGDLYVNYPDNTSPPSFTWDPKSGDLYVDIPER